MLVPAPFAVLTPYNRGTKLPKVSDVRRLNSLTPEAYSTARLKLSKSGKRHRMVEKTLREANISITEAEPRTGLVRLRNGGVSAFDEWQLELFNGACSLNEVHCDQP